MKFFKHIIFAALTFIGAFNAHAAEEVGSVDTAFKLLGSNHKIVIEVFDDPVVSV